MALAFDHVSFSHHLLRKTSSHPHILTSWEVELSHSRYQEMTLILAVKCDIYYFSLLIDVNVLSYYSNNMVTDEYKDFILSHSHNLEFLSMMSYSRFWRSESSPYWMQRKMLSDESSAYLHYTKAPQNVLVLMIHLRKRSGRWVIYE